MIDYDHTISQIGCHYNGTGIYNRKFVPTPRINESSTGFYAKPISKVYRNSFM